MIELRDVSHAYDGKPVLQGVNLTLTERRIGVVGCNGSGKSTFARLLNGLLLPSHGQVLVDGLNTREKPKEVRRRVGFVFQNPDNQIVFPVVEEDLAFGLKNLKLPPVEIEARITEVLARYDLQAFRQHSSHVLSGGQKQLMAIAGVLVMQPDYVVFDEPTTLLDLRNRNRIVQVIRELPQTAIVVTHDLDLLQDFERVLVFDGGRVVMDAPPAQAVAFYRELMAQ